MGYEETQQTSESPRDAVSHHLLHGSANDAHVYHFIPCMLKGSGVTGLVLYSAVNAYSAQEKRFFNRSYVVIYVLGQAFV